MLVIAGFLHLFHACAWSRVKKIKRSASRASNDDEAKLGPPMSQAYASCCPSPPPGGYPQVSSQLTR